METTELEQKILETAERLFLEKGFAGTSTTDIAREVGCNQALVHYYYRTKERLFERIFNNKIDIFLHYADTYHYDGDFWGSFQQLFDIYFTFLNEHRNLPFFFINELALNKERRQQIFLLFVSDERRQRIYYTIDAIVQEEVKKGTIRPIETFNLLIDCVSLVAMTFVSLPMITDLLQKTDAEINEYIAWRKQEILILLKKGLTADS